MHTDDLVKLPGIRWIQDEGYWGGEIVETGQELDPVYFTPQELIDELFPTSMGGWFYAYSTYLEDPLCGECAKKEFLEGNGVIPGELLDYYATEDIECAHCYTLLAEREACEYHGTRFGYVGDDYKWRCRECELDTTEYCILIDVPGAEDGLEDLPDGLDEDQAVAHFHDVVEDVRAEYDGMDWAVILERSQGDGDWEELASERSRDYRDLASAWHGGMGSALYEYASTGRFLSEERVQEALEEVAECQVGGGFAYQQELDSLRRHLEYIAKAY